MAAVFAMPRGCHRPVILLEESSSALLMFGVTDADRLRTVPQSLDARINALSRRIFC